MSSKCAMIILEQMGGNKFLAMTGAKNICYDPISITFQLMRNAMRIKWVRIILDEDDTYIINFVTLVKGVPVTKTRLTGIYADNLQSVFTQHTGLCTSL